MKKFISVLLSLVIFVSVFSAFVQAYAAETIVVRGADFSQSYAIEGNDASSALRQALTACYNRAKSNDKYTITMPSGSYNITENLFLPSNTTLDMRSGTSLRLNTPTGTNIFKNHRDTGGYNDLVNFSMLGGTLYYNNSFESTSCLLRLSHLNNVLFSNVTFKNNGFAHCIELAASKNVRFDSCKFLGAVPYYASSGEALQIDILEPNEHFPNMPPYDYTMNYGITVQNCIFKDLRRGVGTNSLFAGLYQRNIKIIDNTFDRIGECAINATGYISSTISGNSITNTGWGIKYVMMKSDDNLDDACIQNVVPTTVNRNCNTNIIDNTVKVRPTQEMPLPVGIQVFGNNTAGKSNPYLRDNYVVSNINVSNNRVNVYGAGVGIRLFDTINSKVTYNTINSSEKENQGIFFLSGSNNNTVSHNCVNGFHHGITAMDDCGKFVVAYNNVRNTKSAGIYLDNNNGSVNNNLVCNTGESGIVLNRGTYSNVSNNRVSNAGLYSIKLKNVTATNIVSNISSNSTKDGIRLETKCSATNITQNRINNSGKSGIAISSSNITKIEQNTIDTTGSTGIYLYNASNVKSLAKNKVTASKSDGIGLDVTSSATTIKSNNMISSQKYGLYFGNGAKATVYNNAYSKNKKGNAYSAGKTNIKFGNISVPSFSISKSGKTATLKWKKNISVTSYEIYRSTSKNGTYSKIATISSSKTSYKNTKLSKNKTYYYKVRAVKKANNVVAYSNYSSIKSIKI